MSPQPSHLRAPGVPCPACAHCLTVSLEALLAGDCPCPSCGFAFHLEHSRARPILEKLWAAQKSALALLRAL
jgi:hypothetical protein